MAAGVDLLLAEATLAQTDVTGHGHLSGADAGCAAAQAGVGRLVLTHFASIEPEWLRGLVKAASGEFTGPVTLAEPGLTIEVRD